MIFRRRKTEKPKSPLGLALYKYDSFHKIELKNLLSAVLKKKISFGKKNSLLISTTISKIDNIMEDISKENFKTDYRSDKTRDEIINMISGFRAFLEGIASAPDNPDTGYFEEKIEKLNELSVLRLTLKKKMKDIESDYL